MNNTITIYELLGLIKDGKAPKKIKILDDFYEYDKYNEFYYNEEGYSLYRLFYEEGNALDIEVKILEEDKPIIEKIDTTTENTLFTMECYTGIPEQAQDWNFKVLKNKLNEVIDYINRREDK